MRFICTFPESEKRMFRPQKMLLLMVFLLMISVGQAQLTPERKHRVDSILKEAQNPANEPKVRFKAYRKINKTIYKDLVYGQQIVESYMQYCLEEQDSHQLVNALHFIGFGNLIRGNLNEALVAYQEGLGYAQRNDWIGYKAMLSADVGNVFLTMGVLDSAEFYNYRSLVYAEEGERKRWKARALLNLGEIYGLQGKYKSGIDSLELAYQVCQEAGIYGYNPAIFMELGDLNLSIGEVEVARSYYKKALESATKNGFYNRQVDAQIKLAELEVELGKPETALLHLDSGLTIAEERGLMLSKSDVLKGLASIELSRKTYGQALTYTLAAIKIQQDLGVQKEAEELGRIAGEALLHQNRLEEARSYLENAYALAIEHNNIVQQKEISLLLFTLYKRTGENGKALASFEKHHQLKSVLEDEAAVKELIKREFQQDFEKQTFQDSVNQAKELELLNLEHQRTTDRQKAQNRLAVGGAGVLALALLALVFFFVNKNRHNRELSAVNEHLENALKDKVVLLKEINHRVKNNMQVASSMLQLEMKKTDETVVQDVLGETLLRFQSMQLAHQKMYDGVNFDSLDLTMFTGDFVRVLRASLLPANCEVHLEGPEVIANVEQVQAIGFILQELIANSAKHAWDEQDEKEIWIRYALYGEQVELRYQDNGKGLPEGFQFQQAHSFGLKLVNSLVTRQLIGKIQLKDSTTPGLDLRISFKRR